jgi:hypothetical protein
MKVLAATTATQGAWPNDVCTAAAREFVRPPTVEHPGEPVDDACSGRRILVGVDSGQPTTTVQVVEWRGLIPDELRQVVFASLQRAGAARPGDCDSGTWAVAVAAEFVAWPAPFEVGTILELRATTLRACQKG